MFINAQRYDESRNREIDLGSLAKGISWGLFNQRNFGKDTLAPEHCLKICVWTGKRGKG